MRNGLSAGPLPADLKLKYADPIQRACLVAPTFSPLVAYAIAWRETIMTDVSGWLGETFNGANACNVITGGTPEIPDKGYGMFQLTPSASGIALPPNWDDPYENCLSACTHWFYDAEQFWAAKGIQGTDLVRCIAAEFNAGRSGALAGHGIGNVDAYTAGHDYAATVATTYVRLLSNLPPLFT